MNKSLLIDFDGTVVEHAFPRIGKPMPQVFEVLKELQEAGWKLILWTCREDVEGEPKMQFLTEAVEFCRQNGIEFDAVNESFEDFREGQPSLKRKPYATWCIDDRNLGGFLGWDLVREAILGPRNE
jgi:hypothetical protein